MGINYKQEKDKSFFKYVYEEGNNIQKLCLLLMVLHIIFSTVLLYFQEILGSHFWNDGQFSPPSKTKNIFFIQGGRREKWDSVYGEGGYYYGITLEEGILWIVIFCILFFCMKLFQNKTKS